MTMGIRLGLAHRPERLRAPGDDHVRVQLDQLPSQGGEPIDAPLGVPTLHDDRFSLDVAQGGQRVPQDRLGRGGSRSRGKGTHAWNLRGLLRLGGERRGEGTGERGQQEAAAVHYSIT
jgi:hypothetical protein